MDRTVITPPGIYVNDSNKSIRIFFMYNGIRCRETINLIPNKANIIYCANLRAEIISRIARNIFNYAEYFPNSKLAKKLGIICTIKEIYCKDLFEEQLNNYQKMVENSQMSSSTLHGYKKIILGQLIPYFGKYKIHNLTTPLIRSWIKSLAGNTSKTIINYIIPLRRLLDDCVNNGLIEDNPINKISLNRLINSISRKSEFIADPFNNLVTLNFDYKIIDNQI